jgi:hypothetical protein
MQRIKKHLPIKVIEEKYKTLGLEIGKALSFANEDNIKLKSKLEEFLKYEEVYIQKGFERVSMNNFIKSVNSSDDITDYLRIPNYNLKNKHNSQISDSNWLYNKMFKNNFN